MNDVDIRELYNSRRAEISSRNNMPEPEFGPSDLIGKTIIGYREVDSKMDNPRF